MARVWATSTAKGSALLLLLAIADHAHDDGTGAWPSQDTLAAKTRLSARQVRRLIAGLEGRGELRIEKRPGTTDLLTVLAGVDNLSDPPSRETTPDVRPTPDIAVSATPDMRGRTPDIAVSYEPSVEPSLNRPPEPSSSEDDCASAVRATHGENARPTSPGGASPLVTGRAEEVVSALLETNAKAGDYARFKIEKEADKLLSEGFDLETVKQCARTVGSTRREPWELRGVILEWLARGTEDATRG